jgi:hypothetical protein
MKYLFIFAFILGCAEVGGVCGDPNWNREKETEEVDGGIDAGMLPP